MNRTFAAIAASFVFSLALVSSVEAEAGRCGASYLLALCGKSASASKQLAPHLQTHSRSQSEDRLDINAASVEELHRLPGIGQVLASRIVEHRRRHGLFRRAQDIVIVRGMSAKLYRRIAHLIRV